MEYRWLGNTGLKVSRLCFGALTIGPLQSNLAIPEGASVIRSALEGGVNFIDTAELYGTYSYIREALKDWDKEVLITSKSYAYTEEAMEKALKGALEGLDREVIDVFLLHEQESELTIKGHWPALEYLRKAKERGLVRAIGISTHTVAAVKAAVSIPEIEVIHPMVNFKGIGINDGSIEDMLTAIREAYQAGKGIYGMKALGGGHLLAHTAEALAFVIGLPELAAVALGMKTLAEVEMNLKLFNGEQVSRELKEKVASIPRRLHIEEWCRGCGSCLQACPAQALVIEGQKVVVTREKCVLCGYCGARCPDFCLKII